jgi:CRISPR-associated protein Csx3
MGCNNSGVVKQRGFPVFQVQAFDSFSVLTFDIPGGVINPQDLQNISVPEVPFNQGIIISGRGPVWLFAFLCHHFHPALWVATHDPRLGGGVVVQTHQPGVAVGEVIPF